jgi:hypothetical protein
MSSSSLSNIAFDFIIFLLNTLTNLLFNFHHHYSTHNLPDDTDTQHHRHLQAACATLLRHKDELSRRIEEIDIAIHNLQESPTTSISRLPTEASKAVLSPESTRLQTLQRTPIRIRTTNNNRQSRANDPYPLPYCPPRTPDEERKNRIVAWVNELRTKNKLSS